MYFSGLFDLAFPGFHSGPLLPEKRNPSGAVVSFYRSGTVYSSVCTACGTACSSDSLSSGFIMEFYRAVLVSRRKKS